MLKILLTLALATAAPTDRLVDDAGLGASADGRLLLDYTVQCALPADATLRTTQDGRDIALRGSLGLAPQWRQHALSPADQRWMTACILSRLNAFGIKVLLSLRGDHPALRAVDDEERRRYTFEEGAFYGNLFADPPVLYACAGAGGELPAATRRLRVCTEPAAPSDTISRCGLTIAGACAAVCDTHDGVYRHCRGDDKRYDEVLSVFLDTSDKPTP